MEMNGSFKVDRSEFRRGEPVTVTLVLVNPTDRDLYLFVPRGPSSGLHLEVRQGGHRHVPDLTTEPEAGLIPEVRLSAGGAHRQVYLLTQWLRFEEPGACTVECTADIKVNEGSIRHRDGAGRSRIVPISTTLHLLVV